MPDQSRNELKAGLLATLSLGNQRLFAAMLLLTIVPLWFSPYLPMVDMPQHAGQVEALRQLWRGNGLFSSLFEINWFTPYLLGYLLLFAASLIMPITVATQLIVSVAVVCVPILVGELLKAANSDVRWKWLAIPSSFSFAFYWGFLSFLVAVPIALLFLIQTVRYEAQPNLRRAGAIACFAVALFFCHIIILGFAGLVAAGYIVARNYPDWRRLVVRLLPLLAPLPLIIGWLFFTFDRETSVHSDPVVYGHLLDRVVALLVQPSGRETFSPWITGIVTAVVALFPLAQGARLCRKPERWMPFILGVVVFFVMPHYLLSTAYVYQRLGVFLIPLWLMAWEPAEQPRQLDWLAIVVVAFWALSNAGRFAGFAGETQSFRRIMAQIEPGHRMASMIVERSSTHFALPVYLHFPLWYQAQRAGVVDFNFADFLPQMVRYRGDAGPRMTDLLGWYPTQFQWDVNGGDRYDYFLVRCSVDASGYIFKNQRSLVELVARQGPWWLYRRTDQSRRDESGVSAVR